MHDHPIKQRPPLAEKSHAQGSRKARSTSETKSLATFLMESDYWPLVFLGKSVRFFGLGAVASFFLGAACVYGYAVFKPLPGSQFLSAQPRESPTPIPSPSLNQPKLVWLHGVVKSNDKPIKDEIEIGVLETRQGPFQNGAFSIQVPESERYLVTLWNVGYRNFKLVELRPDSDGNVHDVGFSSVTAGLADPANHEGRDFGLGLASTRERLQARSTAADKGKVIGLTDDTRSGAVRLHHENGSQR